MHRSKGSCESPVQALLGSIREPLRGSHQAPNHGGNHGACPATKPSGAHHVNQKTFLRRGAPIAAALALGAGAGAGVYAGVWSGGGKTATSTVTGPAAQSAAVTTTISSLTQLYKDVTPGVVDITVDSNAPAGGFGQQGGDDAGRGLGLRLRHERPHRHERARRRRRHLDHRPLPGRHDGEGDARRHRPVDRHRRDQGRRRRERAAPADARLRRRTCCRARKSSRSAARSGSPTA